MMTDNSIPIMNQPSNMMENGLNSNSLQTSALQKHPIDELQRRQGKLRSNETKWTDKKSQPCAIV